MPNETNHEHHVLRDSDDGDRFAWRARIRANPHSLFWYRIGVGVLGALLIIASGLTGWLPGPGGIPLFLAGMAVWASEFAWAKSLMEWFIRQGRRYLALSRRGKAKFWACVAACSASVWYLMAVLFGVPKWLPDSVEDALRTLPGI